MMVISHFFQSTVKCRQLIVTQKQYMKLVILSQSYFTACQAVIIERRLMIQVFESPQILHQAMPLFQ